MPVLKCENGNYRIGSGPCMYTTKEAADIAYRAFLAKKHSESTGLQEEGFVEVKMEDEGSDIR